jgi:hypothetical protein
MEQNQGNTDFDSDFWASLEGDDFDWDLATR